MMVATEGSVIYPAVVVKVNNILCRALLDLVPVARMHPQHFLENSIYVQSGEKQSALK